VFLDDLKLQRSEEYLISAGEGRAVTDVRNHYQQAIEITFRAAVERATGRRVISFASVTKLDPHYAVEIFRLGPAKEPDASDPRSPG
jgi:Na+-translocating membrane potential-generating system (MpsC)